ncbi:hypothetical protein E3J38_01905 [candidate division TA06 bacterium]|uniref:Uncharacterized protein n=1 Tax=candidate division TA06 bacterium TaxID=2250710 RepID=A0A523XTM0_UNCT6|nr:MAG: hypothetical protein E3J38_01905 [candidate division TA06 bacterium]
MEIIDFEGKKMPANYLGDGVYAIFDGYGVWLHTNHHEHPTDRVYLEPQVLEGLVAFNKEVKSEEVVKRIKQLNE